MAKIVYYCACIDAPAKRGVNSDGRISYGKVIRCCRRRGCKMLLYAVVTKQRLAEGRV